EPLPEGSASRLPVVRAAERTHRRLARDDDPVAAAPAAQVLSQRILHAVWITKCGSDGVGTLRDSLRETRRAGRLTRERRSESAGLRMTHAAPIRMIEP